MHKKLRVLVACEESQAVCKAFRKRGHAAYSCDILPCSGGHPEWHILGDVLPMIDGDCEFVTQDGLEHKQVGEWDMLIAFPPCTYLSNAGATRLFPNKILCLERYKKGLVGKDFFMQFLNAKCQKICVENPVASRAFRLPPYSQIIQPYEHGHEFQKKTCLWLKNLPFLAPTKVVNKGISWVSSGSVGRKNKGTKHRDAKTRSKTFEGIAEAMAEQFTKPFYVQGSLLDAT